MAEAVISIIAEKIIEILGSKAIETVAKLRNIKHELNALSETVSILQPVLDHAEEQYHQNRRIRVWVDQLKDALYEAQDVLEEFNIEDIRRELRGHNEMMKGLMTFLSSSTQLAFNRKMSDKVRALKVRIEAIEAKRSFPLEERSKRNIQETHLFIVEGDIKGREDDKKTVMKFLVDLNVEENVSILPIVGIGGLGKTALAKYVYEYSKFDLKMWVCASTDFDEKKLVKKILTCAKKEEQTADTLELLQSKLRAEIDGKKYLLVLDDVWDIEQETWLKLKPLLAGGARGSKILVTTRIPLVAEIMGTVPPHFLGDLSERASVELLMQVAGRKIEEIQDSGMLEIGKEIVRKCSRVPLVIRTVGRLLSSKKSELEWSQFKDDKLLEVCQSEDRIISVLKLSYDNLPSHLKQCFAFCSLFPKDYEIKKQTLVNLWVAEGFIQPSNKSQHLEDIAHEYFMDLLGRNLFQDFKINSYMDEETCKMHDLMHDLACLVAGNECLVARDDMEFIHERTRHISYASALRTFLSTTGYWEERESTSEADLHQLIQNFKRLRILDLHCTKVKKVPRSIYKLKHLTYLDLSKNSRLKRLPNSITRLQSLQTLNLNGCSDLEELPSDIRKLVSLRNLDLDACSKLSYLPRGLGELSSLHRLTCFILPKDKACAKNYCGLGELKGLNNIRGSLSIRNLRYVTNAKVECENANLMGKHSLESLSLNWSDFSTDDNDDDNDDNNGNNDKVLLDELRPPSNLRKLTIWSYQGEGFPRWMMNSLVSSLPHLVELHFHNCKRCKRLPSLGQLSRLKSLSIWDLPELEYIEWDHSSPSTALFPSLSKLVISDCKKLKAVTLTPSDQSSTSTASFVSLSKLTIRGCEILEAMPLTPHLEELTLIQCNGAVLINHMMFGLNKLKRLFLWRAKFPGCLPEGFQSLTSLESLTIEECHQLTSLSQSMRHLSSLEGLFIRECNELDISKDESGNILDFHGCLPSLRFVYIEDLPKLTSLPQWLLQARNLERLNIWRCGNLKDIPE
ncbi:hypothetical protein EUGRSUZ_B01177 [Eucalyptus grandis]|uniref:NB-ARC domain-containing protein n=2 Tax=Eucalyptus grandis TaxID=71139 RepID=A0A059D1H7_EUCGR|nr:hypothetical protein EUGRSUZ_B01177 [Eucalyptus grandis]